MLEIYEYRENDQEFEHVGSFEDGEFVEGEERFDWVDSRADSSVIQEMFSGPHMIAVNPETDSGREMKDDSDSGPGEYVDDSIPDCVEDVMNEGHSKPEAYAICTAQLDTDGDGESEYKLMSMYNTAFEKMRNDINLTPPEVAQKNAQMAIDVRKDAGNPGVCGGEVDWNSAEQISNGGELTEDRVAQMAQSESHQKYKNQDEEGRSDCSWIMRKALGGNEGVDWAQRKMDEIGKSLFKTVGQLSNMDKQEAVPVDETYYSEINDSRVTILDIDGNKVRVQSEDGHEWWERMQDVRDKVEDDAWEETEEARGEAISEEKMAESATQILREEVKGGDNPF